MRRISTKMIKPHMSLARPIYFNDRLLLKEGCKDINRYIHSLESIGIYHIYIEDEESEGIEFSDIIALETKNKCKKALSSSVKTFVEKGNIEIGAMSESIEQLLDEILKNPGVLVSLNEISATDDETFVHSISTTIYSLLIGKQLGYDRKMMSKLAMGTLLHDLGKTIIDKNIMFKPSKLTKEEFKCVQQHTTLGYQALKQCDEISELSRIIALTHHEKIDGSGYPNGLTGNELHEFSKIVAVADIYDALTMDRCYRKSWSAKAASEYIIENSADKLDAKLAALLLQQIALYPNGTMVTLSNHCMGLVKEQNFSMPLRPVVRILKDEYGRSITPFDLNLFYNLSITIIDSEGEDSMVKVQ